MAGPRAIDEKDLESIKRMLILIDDHHFYKYFTTYKWLVLTLPQKTLL